MDGFTGVKTAAAEEIPAAVAVMDPFHVVRLAGDALNDCRHRVQQTTRGRRGRKNDPLYRAWRPLHPGADLLPDKQAARLTALFAIDEHVEVEATWGITSGCSTGPAPATVRPKRSTAAWSTCAAPPSASATSPTTSPDPYSRQADSDPDYLPALVKSGSSWGSAKDTTETGNQ